MGIVSNPIKLLWVSTLEDEFYQTIHKSKFTAQIKTHIAQITISQKIKKHVNN
jgi:hypothetical protein